MAQQHELRWDDTLPPFAGPGSELPEVGYAIEAMADGSNFGNPEALIEVVRSLLSDGSLAVLEGWDNRVAPIRLRISAPTAVAGPALADAEKALMAAVLRTPKAPLVYVPPAQDAETCVFDVVAAELTRDTSDGWDTDEHQREERYYLLTLTCLPFARAENTVVVEALPPAPESPTTVVIDDCSSLTNWSAGVGLTGPPPTAGDDSSTHASLVRTDPVSMGATPYLKITTTATYNGSPITPLVFIDGTQELPLARVGDVVYVEPPSSFTTLSLLATPAVGASTAPASTVQVTEVARTDDLPTTGSARQVLRMAEVAGSAPTQAALRVYASTVLGEDILVHTSKNPLWQPALRPHRTSSSTVTTDATMVSGSRNTLATAMNFRMPANLFTEGTYSLLARMNVAVAGDLLWEAFTVRNSIGSGMPGTSIVTSGTVSLSETDGDYRVINLAALPLPVLRTEAGQYIQLRLTGTADMTVDEAWLFGLHDGALTWLRDDDLLTWIEIRSPELDDNRPSVFGGDLGDLGENSVCVDWKCESFGTHRFDPGPMQIFTVTSYSVTSQCEIEFYPRYHSHVEGSSAA